MSEIRRFEVRSSKLTKWTKWSPMVRKTVFNVFPKLVFMGHFWSIFEKKKKWELFLSSD